MYFSNPFSNKSPVKKSYRFWTAITSNNSSNCYHTTIKLTNFVWIMTVGSLVWAEFVRRLTQRDTHFRMRVFLGTILICFLVLSIWVPRCLWNRSGVNPGFWVQKTTHLAWKGTRNAALSPNELPGQFFRHCTLNFLWNPCKLTLLIFNNICVPWRVVRGMFLMIIPVDDCFFLFTVGLAVCKEGNIIKSVEDLFNYYFSKTVGKKWNVKLRKIHLVFNSISNFFVPPSVFSLLQFIQFLWRETWTLTRQAKVQLRKSIFINEH